jgi:DNA-binding Xre family transcriptional regulator
MTTRRIEYNWHLRRIMAAHNMWKTTDLTPLLGERGINLSAAQVYRLVAEKPERLPLRTLVALCDIFDCTPADLVEPVVEATGKRATAASTATRRTPSADKGSFRPRPARIVTDDGPMSS